MVDNQDLNKKWGKLVAKSWTDNKLRARLKDEPHAVLAEHGMTVPPGVQVRVVENTESVVYLPIPAKPSEAELSEVDLDVMARGIRGNDSCSVTYFPARARESLAEGA
jgi:hypothetical protein